MALRPIMPHLEDDDVREIAVNAFDEVWIKRYSQRGWLKSEAKWIDMNALETNCVRVTEVTGRRLNSRKPIYDGRLPGGERINIEVPPCCAKVSITIRKFPKEPMTLALMQEEHG